MDEIYTVYVRADQSGRIINVNSSAFLDDTTGWVEIDRGKGMRYYHAQGNYFPKPIYTEDGIPIYKLVNGEAVERTAAEIDADRPAPDPAQDLSLQERINDLEIAICELMDAMA